MRTCCICRQSLPESLFSRQSHLYLEARCKPCNAKRTALRRKPKNSFRTPAFPHGLDDRDLYPNLTEGQIGYIAGIIDGEGCISSSYPTHGRRPLGVAISMIHRPTIEWLHQICGGSFSMRSKKPGTRQSWSWGIRAIRTASLLKKIRPYCIVKADEIDAALNIGESLHAKQRRGRITPETIALRNHYGQLLRDLKKREWK